MPRQKKELTKNQVAILTAIITSVSLIIVSLVTGLFSLKNKQEVQKSPITVNPVISPVFNNNINTRLDSAKKPIKISKKTIKGKNINTGVNNGIIGDNGVQNFGIQPRIITEQSEIIEFLLTNYTDKSIRIGFVAPSQEGEILNVKKQIVKILLSKGYSNVEELNGIRLMFDANLPSDRIVLLNNALGGISFYIPSALK